jgi:ribosome maturation factor RimP
MTTSTSRQGSASDALRTLTERAVATAGLVLEDVTVTPAGRRRVLRVTVDLPQDRTGGVPVDAVAQASHAVSAALDASDVMGGAPYVLEVSSPGVDRPLLERRHWARARGRLVRVVLASGGEVQGRLTEVDDGGVLVDGARLAWADLARGRVEVEFARVDDADLDDVDLDDVDLDDVDLDDADLDDADLEPDSDEPAEGEV